LLRTPAGDKSGRGWVCLRLGEASKRKMDPLDHECPLSYSNGSLFREILYFSFSFIGSNGTAVWGGGVRPVYFIFAQIVRHVRFRCSDTQTGFRGLEVRAPESVCPNEIRRIPPGGIASCPCRGGRPRKARERILLGYLAGSLARQAKAGEQNTLLSIATTSLGHFEDKQFHVKSTFT